MTNLNVKAIFDNGGSLILQLGNNYAHNYDNMAQAARDYKEFLANGNTNGWEGNEQELIDIEIDNNQIRNGGYKVFDNDDIQKLLSTYTGDEDDCCGWNNISEFISSLA